MTILIQKRRADLSHNPVKCRRAASRGWFVVRQKRTLRTKILSAFIAFTFIFSLVLPPGYAQLLPQTILNLPAPGSMVSATTGFTPPIIKGITIHPENPFEFDFIIGTGDQRLKGEAFKTESKKMIKYFLATLTVPEEELWVNLSPYEKDRIIPQGFGDTEMGRDLLAQDYLLKQLTASMMYPEKELGQEFWRRVYTKAREMYGTAEIPLNTFNKIWIVPQEALVYEQGSSAFVIKSHLKVMLEEDYEAAQHLEDGKSKIEDGRLMENRSSNLNLQSSIIKEVLIPEIEREVNEGQTFANLRQIYNSVILAAWYKENLKESLLGQIYVDKTKTLGVDTQDKKINQKIYNQYLEAFKKGVYNYIREDYDPATQRTIPRKYFSGGLNLKLNATAMDARPVLRSVRGKLLSAPDKQAFAAYTKVEEGAGNELVNVELAGVSKNDVEEVVDVTQKWETQQEAKLARAALNRAVQGEPRSPLGEAEGHRRAASPMDVRKVVEEFISLKINRVDTWTLLGFKEKFGKLWHVITEELAGTEPLHQNIRETLKDGDLVYISKTIRARKDGGWPYRLVEGIYRFNVGGGGELELVQAAPVHWETLREGDPSIIGAIHAMFFPKDLEVYRIPASSFVSVSEWIEKTLAGEENIAIPAALLVAEKQKREYVIGGNWKMAVETEEKAVELIRAIAQKLNDAVAARGLSPEDLDIVIAVAPSFVHLPAVRRELKRMEGLIALGLGAQDVSAYEPGARTSETSAKQLADLGIRYVIIGHSERRRGDVRETSGIVNAKVKKVLEQGLIPIIAVGETLEEREAGRTFDVLRTQFLESTADLTAEQMKNVVIAYEPVWAIGTGKTATPQEADEAQRFLRAVALNRYGQAVAGALRIQYGGSMNAANVGSLIQKYNIDGGLIGGAALKPDDFVKIVTASLEHFNASLPVADLEKLAQRLGVAPTEVDGVVEEYVRAVGEIVDRIPVVLSVSQGIKAVDLFTDPVRPGDVLMSLIYKEEYTSRERINELRVGALEMGGLTIKGIGGVSALGGVGHVADFFRGEKGWERLYGKGVAEDLRGDFRVLRELLETGLIGFTLTKGQISEKTEIRKVIIDTILTAASPIRTELTVPEGQKEGFFTNVYHSYRIAELFAQPQKQIPDAVVAAIKNKLEQYRTEGKILSAVVKDFGGTDIDIHVTHRYGELNAVVSRLVLEAMKEGALKAQQIGFLMQGMDINSLGLDDLGRKLRLKVNEHSITERGAEPVVIAKIIGAGIGAANIKLYHEFFVPGATPLQKLGFVPVVDLAKDKLPVRGFRAIVRRTEDVLKGDFDGPVWEFEKSAALKVITKDKKEILYPSKDESLELMALASQPNDYQIIAVYPVEGSTLPSTEPVVTVVHQPVYGEKGDLRTLNPTFICRSQSGADAVGGIASMFYNVNFVPGGPKGEHYVAAKPVTLQEARKAPKEGIAHVVVYGWQSKGNGIIPQEKDGVIDHVAINPEAFTYERKLANFLASVMTTHKDEQPYLTPFAAQKRVEPIREKHKNLFARAPKEADIDPVMDEAEAKITSGEYLSVTDDKADMGGKLGHNFTPEYMLAIDAATTIEAREKGMLTDGNIIGHVGNFRLKGSRYKSFKEYVIHVLEKGELPDPEGKIRSFIEEHGDNWQMIGYGMEKGILPHKILDLQFDFLYGRMRSGTTPSIGDDSHIIMLGDKSRNSAVSHQLSFLAFTRGFLFAVVNGEKPYGLAQDYQGKEAKAAKANPYFYSHLNERFFEILRTVMPEDYLAGIEKMYAGWKEWQKTSATVTLPEPFSGNVSQQGIGSARYLVDIAGGERQFGILAGDKMGPAALNRVIREGVDAALKAGEFKNGLVYEIWDAKAFDEHGNIPLDKIPASFADVKDAITQLKDQSEHDFVVNSYSNGEMRKDLTESDKQKLAKLLKKTGYVPTERIFLEAEVDKEAIDLYLADSDRFNVKQVWEKSKSDWDINNPQEYLLKPMLGSSVTKLGILAGGEYIGKDDPVMVGNMKLMRHIYEFLRANPLIIQGDMNGSHWLAALPTAFKYAVANKESHPILVGLVYTLSKDGKTLASIEDIFGDKSYRDIRRKLFEFNYKFKQAQLGGQFEPYGTNWRTVEASYPLAKLLRSLNTKDSPFLVKNKPVETRKTRPIGITTELPELFKVVTEVSSPTTPEGQGSDQVPPSMGGGAVALDGMSPDELVKLAQQELGRLVEAKTPGEVSVAEKNVLEILKRYIEKTETGPNLGGEKQSSGSEILHRLEELVKAKTKSEVDEITNDIMRILSTSSPVEEIKELTPSSAPQEIENVVKLASEKQKFEGDPDAVALAGTLKYEGKQMRFEDGYLVSFNGRPILKLQIPWRGPSQQPEIFKVNGNPPVHFTSKTFYLEIPGDREHLLKFDSTRIPVKNWYVVSRISRWQFEMEKEYPPLLEMYEILAEGIIVDSMKIGLLPEKTVSVDVLVRMLGWPREKVLDTIKKMKGDPRWWSLQIKPDALDAAATTVTVSRKQSPSEGHAQEVALLIKTLEGADEDLREGAAYALGSVRPTTDEIVNALDWALRLKDQPMEVRRMAARALKSIGTEKAIHYLASATTSVSEDVRDAAQEALESASSPVPGGRAERLRIGGEEEGSFVLHRLAGEYSRSGDEVIRWLKEQDGSVDKRIKEVRKKNLLFVEQSELEKLKRNLLFAGQLEEVKERLFALLTEAEQRLREIDRVWRNANNAHNHYREFFDSGNNSGAQAWLRTLRRLREDEDHLRSEFHEWWKKEEDSLFRSSSPASSSVSEERVPTAARLVGMEATSGEFKKGGIDLNPMLMDMKIKRDGNGIPLPLPMQPAEHLKIDGFVPVIINVTPIPSLPMFLGLADPKPDTEATYRKGLSPIPVGKKSTSKAREPEEISALN